MANRCSALAAYYPTGLHGRPGEPGVKLQEIPDLSLWQIAGWPDTMKSQESRGALFGQRRNPESPVAESVQISLCGRKKLIAPFYDLQ